MSNLKYEALQSKSPVIDVARVSDGQRSLVVAAEAFGPDTYSDNLLAMGKSYARSDTFEPVKFRPASIAETIKIATANIEDVGPRIIYSNKFLQIGKITLTSDGVYLNTEETDDEQKFKNWLRCAKDIGGIYSTEVSNVVFVPYNTFQINVQSAQNFLQGGLAKGLEFISGQAGDLSALVSPDNFPNGVHVRGFFPTKKGEILHKIMGFDRGTKMSDCRLGINSNYDNLHLGFTFGIVED